MTMTKAQPLQTYTETRNVEFATITVDYAPRCLHCNWPLAYVTTRPWKIKCGRKHCSRVNYSDETKTA